LDAGATWERFALEPFANDDRTVLLLALDPEDPLHLFARVVPSFDANRDEALLRSTDGGETWTEVGRHRRIGGLLFAPDGAIYLGTEWVALPSDPTMPTAAYPHGLYRSDDGGESFTVIRDDLDVGCLGWHQGELWACADNYRDGFMLGSSSDGGESFTARLILTEMAGPVECDPSEATPVACEVRDEDIVRDFEVTGPTPAEGGCQTATGSHGGPLGGAFLLLGFALTMGRRSP